MSLAPSTDLVLEVSRAADPARAAAVKDKLAALSGGAPADDGFHATLGAVAATVSRPTLRSGAPLSAGKKAEHMLESAFLTQFVEEMLPKDTPSAFGQGYAGDMWRSMLAQRVADQMAASGRMGIADKLFSGRPLAGRADLMSPDEMRGLRPHDVTVTSANLLSAPSGASPDQGLFGSPPAL